MIRAIDLFNRQAITKLEKLKVQVANTTAVSMWLNRGEEQYIGILHEDMTLSEIEQYVIRAILQEKLH